MFALFCFVLAILASPFKSKSRLEAENAALRHQLIVLGRKVEGRAQLTNSESHVKDRKGFDMTYFGSTRVVDQASAHSLPRVFTVAGRHISLNRQRFLKQIEGLFVQVLKAIINSQRETTALAQHFGIMSSEPY